MACSTSHIKPTMSQVITNYLVITLTISTQLRHHCGAVYLNSRTRAKSDESKKLRVSNNAMHRENSLINFEPHNFIQNSFITRRRKLTN